MTNLRDIIDKLYLYNDASDSELYTLICDRDESTDEYLFNLSRKVQQKVYGNKVFIRGLIEITSFCKNNCFYCGLQRDNECAKRYRLSKDEILACCGQGYDLGFRTFVLQGGEDSYYTDSYLCGLISSIKNDYPDCAVTLSLGEKSYNSYKLLFDAGADRYLLRHETASKELYEKLHPSSMSYENRMDCLKNLKSIGYQTGCGFMVGPPFQEAEHLVIDLRFIKSFRPHMVGIGPFIPHHNTRFKNYSHGSFDLTLFLLGLIRLMLPEVLLPATTALGTVDPKGKEKGILSGANVIMPNLSPLDVRSKYSIYDGKLYTNDEAGEALTLLKRHIKSIGYEIVTSRGDSKIIN
ncbi:MAG: [FeFe] hydrogenase H-cluster radical SAM maturase HydE [Bacillota bacterium]|nr:[FeFe] hydrogenase H-cluster radical SAM maturase HydE [Bacillota bacterium]